MKKKFNFKKQLIGIMFCLALFFVYMSFTVFAEETYEAGLTVEGETTDYPTLEDAWLNIPRDGTEATVTLYKDAELTDTLRVSEGQNVKLVGGAYTISSNSEAVISNYGKLTIESGIIKNTYVYENGSSIYNANKLIITGGEILGDCGVINLYAATAEIIGGTITGSITAVDNSGTVKLSGAPVITGGYSFVKRDGSEVILTGALSDGASIVVALDKWESYKTVVTGYSEGDITYTPTESDLAKFTPYNEDYIFVLDDSSNIIVKEAEKTLETPDEPETPTEKKNGFYIEDGVKYWYEDDVKQGTEGRGKEIYDPATGAWYWLDAVQGGTIAVSKDVYQESYAGDYADREDGTGKWVRYDENGYMVKGWNNQNGNTYYFDTVTGAMAKGTTEIDGVTYTFDMVTGVLQK